MFQAPRDVRRAEARQEEEAVEGRQLLAVTHPLPGWTILPLRLFLGVTFAYAALQKLADPGFLRPGSPTYIGAQLLAYSRGSPIRSALLHLMEHAAAIGALTILGELTIGVLVLLGLLTRPAALAGLALNMVFFLSASWHTYPYFMGSDIVFVAAWLTLALTGPGVLALDALALPWLEHHLGTKWPGVVREIAAGPLVGRQGDEPAEGLRRLSRAEVLLGALAALGLVVLGVWPRGSVSSAPSGRIGPGGTSGSGGGSGRVPAGMPAGARKIGNVSQLPPNSAGVVTDPHTGDPAIVVHTDGTHFYCYDAVCTHAGCTVQYDPQQRLLVCPCHGGTFDPAHHAAVVAGPPPAPLGEITMAIDGHGNIYIV